MVGNSALVLPAFLYLRVEHAKSPWSWFLIAWIQLCVGACVIGLGVWDFIRKVTG